MTVQANTPFVNTSSSGMIGKGAPIIQVYDVTVLAAAGPTTITLTVPNGYMTKGQVRLKSSAVNAATTITIGNITLSDGTNTVLSRPAQAATAAGQNLDF